MKIKASFVNFQFGPGGLELFCTRGESCWISESTEITPSVLFALVRGVKIDAKASSVTALGKMWVRDMGR